MGMVKEFKEFALKGNVMDMAIGIIIGGAFGLIIKSAIADLIMPIIGIPGKADFANLYFGLTEPVRIGMEAFAAENNGMAMTLDQAKELGPVFAWGNFITVAINFLILAFVIFMMVKMMNKAKAKMEKEEEAAPPAAPAADLVLLGEIRDLLKK
ncbi:MAG: large conductance mechanosensitive channel protein MscL [Phycisphaerales bacterium]|nr:large conductance mechanosensitive channel protein MscL [Phycisphaerales bacterium]